MFWDILKIFLSIYVSILIPIYWVYYGPKNFLWLSDIGLFLTILGLWLKSSLLISTAAVGIIALELAWNIDFFTYLFFKIKLINLSNYMFDIKYPLYLRALSLFHIFMPIIWILYLWHDGYAQNAIYYITFLYWLDLLLIYFFTDPKENINWVFLPQTYNLPKYQTIWLFIMLLFGPLLIFYPTHYIFYYILLTH